jgi:hypothetical protein
MNTIQFAADRLMYLEAGSQFLNNISEMTSFDASRR